MSKLVVSDPDSGEIRIIQEYGCGKEVIDRYAEIGRSAAFFPQVQDVALFGNYVHRGQLRQRPRMLARLTKSRIRADGRDSAEILGVPAGARITFSDGLSDLAPLIADGGVIPVNSPIPCRWSIRIELFPYQDKHFEVVAE